MHTATGLERLLLSESNVSDLIQLLTYEDPAPMAALLEVDFDEVRRESVIGAQRADLVLLRKGCPVAAIELKIGHSFSDEQRLGYEEWARVNDVPSLVLSSLGSALLGLPDEWKFLPLSSVFQVWTGSAVAFVAELATRVGDVLARWNSLVDGVRRLPNEIGSLTFADVENVSLLRVVTREISLDQCARGINSCASVSSGGGNAILQSWTPVRGVEGVFFIADARFEESRVHFRFGIDGRAGTACDVWQVAQTLDDAITVDAFSDFLTEAAEGGVRELGRFEKRGRGRPRAKGDWEGVIATGRWQAGTNPGFLRDGIDRLECGGRISRTELNGWSLDKLMDAVHVHLSAAWTASS